MCPRCEFIHNSLQILWLISYSYHHWNLNYNITLGAYCREYFLSETFLSPDLAWRMRKWWGAHCSVRAKWGNYAFESVHFMFHYPPPSQQQYPPAFLHLVTRKLTSPSPSLNSEDGPKSNWTQVLSLNSHSNIRSLTKLGLGFNCSTSLGGHQK